MKQIKKITSLVSVKMKILNMNTNKSEKPGLIQPDGCYRKIRYGIHKKMLDIIGFDDMKN